MESAQCANPNCKEPFNQTDRTEVLNPCGHSYCLACFFAQTNPQENSFICKLDEYVFNFTEAFKTNLLKKSRKGPLWIVCDVHSMDFVTCFCQKCQAPQ